jgi:hypothetical protein
MRPETQADLSWLWVPLLERLTQRFPDWGLWKNAESALAGNGDFDSTAPESEWDAITAEFEEWAASRGFGPVLSCREVPGVMFLVALDKQRRTFLELDVNARKYFRGWTTFRPDDLVPLMEIDSRGFRRIRPGAEGVILLTQNGLKWGGRPNREGLRRKRVADFLEQDPTGAREMARLFGPAQKALLAGADAVVKGGWNRPAMLVVEAWALLRALAEPNVLLGRFRARRVKRRCVVLRAIFTDDRRILEDADEWLSRVAEDHWVAT